MERQLQTNRLWRLVCGDQFLVQFLVRPIDFGEERCIDRVDLSDLFSRRVVFTTQPVQQGQSGESVCFEFWFCDKIVECRFRQRSTIGFEIDQTQRRHGTSFHLVGRTVVRLGGDPGGLVLRIRGGPKQLGIGIGHWPKGHQSRRRNGFQIGRSHAPSDATRDRHDEHTSANQPIWLQGRSNSIIRLGCEVLMGRHILFTRDLADDRLISKYRGESAGQSSFLLDQSLDEIVNGSRKIFRNSLSSGGFSFGAMATAIADSPVNGGRWQTCAQAMIPNE